MNASSAPRLSHPHDVRALADDLRTIVGHDRVAGPGEAAYTAATTLWNGAVTARPALVVRPRHTADVAAAVTAAVGAGVPMSVRGGGHDWAGRSLRDDGLVVDLADMRDVGVDGRTASAGGGARAIEVVRAAGPQKLLVATGTSGQVGMVGLSTAGGYGPLLGTAGLAADNLLGAEVVLADGRAVSTADDPDLLWALRGGGGNFGIVTRTRIRLHPDHGLVGGIVLFAWDHIEQTLARLADLLSTAPDELTLLAELTYVPDVGPALLVVPVWTGPPAGAEEAMARVRSLGAVVMDTVGPVHQQDLLEQFDQQVPPDMHWTVRTRTIAALTPQIAKILVAAAERRPGPAAGLGVRHFHGVAARVVADETAVGQRDTHLVIEISAGRAATDDPTPYRAWAESVRADLEPHALPGGYPNFLKPDQPDQVAHAYGRHAERLLRLKSRYDPSGVFTGTPLPW